MVTLLLYPDPRAEGIIPSIIVVQGTELEMKGYTQMEGQSTQGSDK